MEEQLKFLDKFRKGDRDLREADVRYRIIDSLFKNVFSWPDEKVKCEDYVNSGYIDYSLYSKTNVPVLLIEAKKEGKYFELPNNANSKNKIRFIQTEQLLTDPNIKSAILQVKEYAEDLGCGYVCITNGHEWIFTHINPQNKPWKKQKSLVITAIDYFIDEYTDAFNFLSYQAITENFSLNKRLSNIKSLKSEAFHPKTQITAYDSTVTNNKYAGIFNLISRMYLSNIPLDDSDFMRKCYVTNKGHHDALQKNVRGFIYDSLTPYFKNLGIRDFIDDKKGGAFGYKVTEIIKNSNLNSVMILFGGRGSGKSTFIERFLYYVRPKEIKDHSLVAIVNLIDSAQSEEELTKEIWKNTLEKIDQEDLLKSGQGDLLNLFSEEFEVFEKQFLNNYSDDSEERQKLISSFLKEKLSDTKFCAQKISIYWKNKSKGLIVVLDNLDQLPPELQDTCFLTAMEISKKLSCLSIISMREERYFNAKSRGTLDAYHTNGFHIASPVITKVLIKRIGYIIEKMDSSQDLENDFDIRTKAQFDTIRAFLIICSKALNNDQSDFSQFLRISTHGDVRRALSFFKSFLTSGYTNINEMTSKRSWTFRKHQVLKPIMIPERFFYDELSSHIPNIFKVRDEKNGSHFTGLRILSILEEKSHDDLKAGLIDCKYLIQIFESKFGMQADCEQNLDILLQRGYIESNNRLDTFSKNLDKVRITASGKYLLEDLFTTFTYLDLVCLDTPIYNEKLNNEFVSFANEEVELYHKNKLYERILVRLEKTNKFISYLKDFELTELEELGLLNAEKVFTNKIITDFETEREKILASAIANT